MSEIIPISPDPAPVPGPFTVGFRELAFCLVSLFTGLFLANAVLFGGFCLGFAIAAVLSVCASACYLHASGHKFDWYTRSLLALSLVIAASFGYSSDGMVKFVLFFFLCAAVNLALCLIAGQNHRSPGSLSSLLDAPRAFFSFGCKKWFPALSGVVAFFRNGSEASRRGGAVILGCGLSVPLLAVLIPLLMRSDAAFEGLMDLFPALDGIELFLSLFWGLALFCVLFSRALALHYAPVTDTSLRPGPRLHPFTVNTVLSVICLVYLVYLGSQLAYFFSGFAGILPEGFTAAEYARRGFFEMAWLCAINLALMACAMALVSSAPKTTPTRLLCLFLGLVTLFLVCASCAKMVLYIGLYGLTRLRLLTMIAIAFLGITTVLVILWLFRPGFSYMRWVVLLALVIGCGILWVDVDTQVARYNVTAYQSGKLPDIDLNHLSTLGEGALPYLYELTGDSDPAVAEEARDILAYRHYYQPDDFRAWTYGYHRAYQFAASHNLLPTEEE